VFWFFYRFFEWRKRFRSSFIASAMVGITMIIHIAFLYSAVRHFVGFPFERSNMNYGQRRLLLLPLVFLFLCLIYFLYYRKRAKVILEKKGGKRFSSISNILIISVLLILPLLAAIIFTNSCNAERIKREKPLSFKNVQNIEIQRNQNGDIDFWYPLIKKTARALNLDSLENQVIIGKR